MRRLLPFLAAALGLAALLSACGGSGTSTASGTDSPVVVDVTISGNQVTPSHDTVDVPLGSSVQLDIHADAPGEIHVQSTPEQHISYRAGTTEARLGAFTVPGQIVVESHAFARPIVTLQVN